MALEHWNFRQNVRQHKVVLRALARLLTRHIRRRGGERGPEHLDFRFLLPLSQWLVEQAGYTIRPQGNNPGNVMGTGDAGRFMRARNVEIVGGKRKVVPAYFAAYSSMNAGTSATFDHLQRNWPGAYAAVMNGGTTAEFVQGLYPGGGKNYATQFQHVYLTGMKYRKKNVVADYIAVAEDDRAQVGASMPALQAMPSQAGFDTSLRGEVDARIALGERTDGQLGNVIAELEKIRSAP